MHPELKRIFDLSIDALKADARVVAGFNLGSVGDNDRIRNYAIFFQSDGLLQYGVNIMKGVGGQGRLRPVAAWRHEA